MSETTTSETDLPNTNGANGAANGAPKTEVAAAPETKDETAPNKKTRAQRRRNKAPAETAVPEKIPAAETAAPTEEQPATEPIETATIEAPPIEPTVEAPTVETPPIETMPVEAPTVEVPVEALRLRMKVWTDPATKKRYLMTTAFMRDLVNGLPVSDVMYAYAMRDDDTKVVTLRAHEWNTLPFFYFQEDGPAPRASARPIDVIG